MMKQNIRLFGMARGTADNVRVVDKLTLFVHDVDERASKVVFVANPNIVEYRETGKSQSVGVESIEDTRIVTMTPSTKPIKVPAGGTVYEIAVESIGTVHGGRHWAYCDFLVIWGE